MGGYLLHSKGIIKRCILSFSYFFPFSLFLLIYDLSIVLHFNGNNGMKGLSQTIPSQKVAKKIEIKRVKIKGN